MGEKLTFIEILAKKAKAARLRREKRNKIKPFSSDELIKYNQLKKEDSYFSIDLIFWPFYAAFWLSLAIIVFKFAWGLDLRLPIGMLIFAFFRIWPLSLLIFFIIAFMSFYYNSRYNKKITELILSERRKR